MKFKETKYGDLTGQTYNGDITVSWMNLTSLEGAPEVVNGNFDCFSNQLTSLKGAPKKVVGYFDCSNNKLTSLEGLPKEIEKSFLFEYNPGKHLNEEYQIRKKNPDLSEIEIKIELAKRGIIKSEEIDGLQEIFFL